MLFEKVVIVNLTPTSRLGRVLALVQQTYRLSPKIGQRVLKIEIAAHLHAVKMIAIGLLNVKLVTLLTKRGGNLAHTSQSLAMTCVTVMTTGTNATTTQAATAMTGPPQGLQNYLLRTSLWIACAQATESLMTQTLVASLSVTVTSHLLETTALAVFHEGLITLIMILLTKVLGFLMIHLVAVLGQQNVLDTPRSSMGGPTPSAPGILTPRIRVQVDHRL
jgi:hypothetical protein